VVIIYFLNGLPLLLLQVIPLAISIATLAMVGNMARNREILSLLTSGISQERIARPLLFLGILVSIGVFFMGEFLVPSCQERARYFEIVYIEGKGEEEITRTDKIFAKGEGNRFYIMEHYDSALNTMTRPTIIDVKKDGGTINLKLSSDSAEFVMKDGENSLWSFKNLRTWEYDEEGELIKHQHMQQPVLISMEKQLDKFLSYRKEPEEMNLWELQRYLSILRNRGENVGRYETDLHLKAAFPISALLLLMICFSFASKMQIGNLILNFAQPLLLVVIFYALVATFQAMGHNLILHPILAAWIPDFLYLGLGIYLFKYNTI
jgi:LPS export ABC transporter permease LptG